jgi:N-acetylmuramoyl-L-alanine amidase
MNDQGWAPFVERQATPNFTRGRHGYKLEAMVIHIMEGGFQSSIDYMKQKGVSASFCVSRTGRMVQTVSTDDTAYGNGLSWIAGRRQWLDPQNCPVKPPWSGLHVPDNPIFYTSSIEHEGFTGTPWTSEMYGASARILCWTGDRHKLVWQPHRTLIGHCEISPVNRARCPGTGVDLGKLAELGNNRPAYAGTYRVAVPAGARVRGAPAVGNTPIDGVLPHGATFVAGHGVVSTTEVNGSNLWLWLANGHGFVHSSLVELVMARRYVVAVERANVRPQPNTAEPPVATVSRGQALDFDRVALDGERIDGDGRWGHLADGRGYISLTTLEAA